MICYALIIIGFAFYQKKLYYAFSIILLFFLTDAFQVIPLKIITIGFFSGATLDAALLLVLSIVFVFKRKALFKHSLFKPIRIFIYFIIFDVFISLLLFQYDFGSIFRSLRNYLFLLSFVIFYTEDSEWIFKFIRLLIILTAIQSLLFIGQIVFNIPLLNGASIDEVGIIEDIGYKRYYNLPKFLDFSFLLCIFFFPFKQVQLKIVLLTLFIVTIVAPLHRAYLLVYFITFIIYVSLFNSFQKRIIYLILILCLAAGVGSIPAVNNRISSAIDEIVDFQKTSSSVRGYTNGGTFSYRINHLQERLDYTLSQPLGFWVGLGLIDDKSPETRKIPFKFGLPDLKTGKITKIYTPDIAWSMLVVNYGILGTVLFVLIFLKLMRFFWRNRADKIGHIGFIIIIVGFLGSFTGNFILLPYFYFSIFITIFLMSRKQNLKLKLK